MGLIYEKLTNFFYKNKNDKANYIFYKIVDSTFANDEEHYKIQCINTKAVIHAKIYDIVKDISILHGLHPVQAAYVGIEYAKFCKKSNMDVNIFDKQSNASKHYVYRYGEYTLLYQDRVGNICFTKKSNDESILMDPRDIVLASDLISNFDSSQAFHIGVLAEFKSNRKIISDNSQDRGETPSKPHLRLIKGELNGSASSV